jgi:anti-anti-sigma regulatory factor
MRKPKSEKKRKPAVKAAAAPAADCVKPSTAAPAPEQPVAAPDAAHLGTVQIDHGLEIKDVERVRDRLLAAFEHGSKVTVDVGQVATIDTAGVQLLLAVRGEASKRGMTVEFRGESPALTRALTVLGLCEAMGR